MKNLLITMCLLAWVSTSIRAQASYLQFEASYVKPKIAQMDMFKKGLAAHAKKYHATDPYKMFTFEVISGPNSGSYFIGLGPATFTQLDNRPSGPEHDADWQNNVRVYLESEGESNYWRLDSTLMYVPAGGTGNFGKSRLRWVTINPGEDDRWAAQMEKVLAVYKAKAYTSGWNVYWKYGFSTGHHACTEMNFKNWADLDNLPNLMKDFEEVHGPGSWARFLDELDLAVDRTKTSEELFVFDPDLSSPQQ